MPELTPEQIQQILDGLGGSTDTTPNRPRNTSGLSPTIILSNGVEVPVTWAEMQGVNSLGYPVIYYIPSFDTDLPVNQIFKEIRKYMRISYMDEQNVQRFDVPTEADLKLNGLDDTTILTNARYASIIKGLGDQGVTQDDIEAIPGMTDFLMQQSQTMSKPNELFYKGMMSLVQKVKANPQYSLQILKQVPGYPVPDTTDLSAGQSQDMWNALKTGAFASTKGFPDEKGYQLGVMEQLQPYYQNWKKQEDLGLFNRQMLRSDAEQAASSVLNQYEKASQRFDALVGGAPQEGVYGAELAAQEEETANLRQDELDARNKAKSDAIAAEKQRKWDSLLNQSRRPQRTAKL